MGNFDRVKLIKQAAGQEKADMVIKNASVVDVLGGQIIKADVAVCGSRIAGVGQYSGAREIDGSGKYVTPSFFDAHLHFESSMMTPGEYIKLAAAQGVTSYMADPHEIANVCGEAGIKFIVDSVKTLPVKAHVKMPSCVPATPLDHGGATLNADDCARLIKKYKLYGLGEMMNYPGIIGCDPDVMKKMDSSAAIDGHAPSVTGENLNAYISAGIYNDHECSGAAECQEKLSKGMYIMLREGSQTCNLRENIKCINDKTLRRFVFCTDDRNVEELTDFGSVKNCVRAAIEEGLDPVSALTIASLNAYECFGIPRHGAIVPGWAADFLITSDLAAQHIEQVYCDGVLIAENGKACFDTHVRAPAKIKKTVHHPVITAADLDLEFAPDKWVMEVFPHTVVTGRAKCSAPDGLNLMACIERHHNTGNIGRCRVKGFGLVGGAIAQTIGHDAHNITVLGDNPEDMALAVGALGVSGGLALAANGRVLGKLTLEVAGLMTEKPAAELRRQREKIMQKLKKLTYNPGIEPFMLLSFLSLIVIPDLKLNDSGLFSVTEWKYV